MILFRKSSCSSPSSVMCPCRFPALTSSQKFIILEPNSSSCDQSLGCLLERNYFRTSCRTRMSVETKVHSTALQKGLTEIEFCPTVLTSFRGTLQVFCSRAISSVRSIPGQSFCTCQSLAEQLKVLENCKFSVCFQLLFQLISVMAPILGLAHAYLLLSLQLGRLRSLDLAQTPPRNEASEKTKTIWKRSRSDSMLRVISYHMFILLIWLSQYGFVCWTTFTVPFILFACWAFCWVVPRSEQ